MKYLVWSIKNDRAATPEELKLLFDNDNPQINSFFAFKPTKKEEGVVETRIAFGSVDEFEIREVKDE
jgi:hypothetical protein